jgi:hypothetical protein
MCRLRSRLTVGVALSTGVCCSALGIRTAHSQSVVTRDSSGVLITIAKVPAKIGRWQLSQKPTISLKEVKGVPPFWQLTAIRRLSDGRIVFIPTKAPDQVFSDGFRMPSRTDIYIHDPRTGSTRRVGREGKGPGEFVDIKELIVMAGDSILVLDRAGTSVLGKDGAFVRRFQLEVPSFVSRRGSGRASSAMDRLSSLWDPRRHNIGISG